VTGGGRGGGEGGEKEKGETNKQSYSFCVRVRGGGKEKRGEKKEKKKGGREGWGGPF